ncbi:hypothetical protein DPMN_140131 [Dreissena polymorpha]|uniref:Uncharacterized protein n=1 Tax=Dreissena polymorpha TaxID=45954 RepID=A0A9D4JGE1_DREPO|nr:hypothetical protein DPMN_140131 [Dreissena polymorpha]
MARQKDGQKDGRTCDHYMPTFGGHKNKQLCIQQATHQRLARQSRTIKCPRQQPNKTTHLQQPKMNSTTTRATDNNQTPINKPTTTKQDYYLSKQLTNQPINKRTTMKQHCVTTQPTNQPTNQLTTTKQNCVTTQPSNLLTNQLTSKPINQLTTTKQDCGTTQPPNQPTN